jgi:hypothetical protein
MGFTLETGIFFLVSDRMIPVASSFVPALQGIKRVMMSPRKQQTVEEDC